MLILLDSATTYGGRLMLFGSSVEKGRTRWYVRSVETVLVVAIPGYFVALFLNRELGVAKFLELPLIFASLLLAIELLQRQGRALESLATRFAAVEGNVADLALIVARLDRGAEITFYRDRQFY